MLLADRLALAALRGVVKELEGDAAGAGDVLAALLGARPVAVATLTTASTPPAASASRPRTRSPRRASRPRPAKAQPGEGARLLEELVVAAGGTTTAAELLGVHRLTINRWQRSEPAPDRVAGIREALERLRASEQPVAVEDDAQDGELEPEDAAQADAEPAALAFELVRLAGSHRAAARAFGNLHPSTLRAWADGESHPSPQQVARLRAAIEERRSQAESEDEDDDSD